MVLEFTSCQTRIFMNESGKMDIEQALDVALGVKITLICMKVLLNKVFNTEQASLPILMALLIEVSLCLASAKALASLSGQTAPFTSETGKMASNMVKESDKANRVPKLKVYGTTVNPIKNVSKIARFK